MKMADWLQFGALLVAFVVLVFTGIQVRELTRQTRYLNLSIKQVAYQSLKQPHNSIIPAMLHRDADLLEWFLKSRGYPTGSRRTNKRVLCILLRIESHEANFLSYARGELSMEVWTAWHNVIASDFAHPEYRLVWKTARPYFAASFANYIDSLRR